MYAPPNPHRTEVEHRAQRARALTALARIEQTAGELASKIRHPAPFATDPASSTWEDVSELGGELAIVSEFLFDTDGGPLG